MHSAEPSKSRDERPFCWAIAAGLVLLVALVYGQTLRFPLLTYDDSAFVVANPAVNRGLTADGIAQAFKKGPMGEWYPLALLSHMLDCQLFGLKHPWGHHLVNVLLHAATVVGLFFVLRSMTGQLWPSAFTAAMLAVHPQHVESVAWVAERRDVLSGLFFVLTLAAWLGYVRHGRSIGRYLLVALLLTLGLMSKAMLVTVPAILFLLDYWPLGRFGQASDLPAGATRLPQQSVLSLVVEKLPLLALALADCGMTVATHSENTDPTQAAWPARLANAPVALMTYLVQTFCPIGLAAFYPFPAAGHPVWKVAGATVLLVAITAAVLVGRRRWPYLMVGWLWFVGMLVPVLGVVQLSTHAMADRYTYLPQIGLTIAVAWSASRLLAGSVDGRWALGGGAVLSIAVLTGCAAWQTTLWEDEVKLWTHSLAATEDNRNAEIALADALNRAGRWDTSIEHYQRAAQWRADAPLLNNLGLALTAQKRYREAEFQFRTILQAEPNSVQAHCNLGLVLADQGRFDEAAQHYLTSIQLAPSLPQPHQLFARMLATLGRFDQAIDQYRQALELPQGDASARQIGAELKKVEAQAAAPRGR